MNGWVEATYAATKNHIFANIIVRKGEWAPIRDMGYDIIVKYNPITYIMDIQYDPDFAALALYTSYAWIGMIDQYWDLRGMASPLHHISIDLLEFSLRDLGRPQNMIEAYNNDNIKIHFKSDISDWYKHNNLLLQSEDLDQEMTIDLINENLGKYKGQQCKFHSIHAQRGNRIEINCAQIKN